MPEEALQYYMAAGDVDEAARLVEQLVVPAYRQGRSTTIQRWVRWLDERGGLERRPVVAVWAALVAVLLGQAAEAERRADAVDRWQYGDPARPADPPAEGCAAMLRALLCRHGITQMRADADEAARKLAAAGIVSAGVTVLQGIGCVLDGDLDGGDEFFQHAAGQAEELGAHEVRAETLAERCLVAMARGDWGRAEALAGQAGTVTDQAGIEDALVRAVQARVAVHRGDVVSARQHLVRAQQVRHLLTHAQPQFAGQARVELIRVHLALADLAGARMLMQEIDELLRWRPGLGTLVGEAEALRAQLAGQRGSITLGASALTTAELRLLPLLSTYLPFPEIASELHLSLHTIKARARSIYRKLDASTRSQAVTRAREWGLLEG